MAARLRQRLAEEGRRVGEALTVRARVVRLLWRASPRLTIAVVGFVLAEGVLPTLAFVAIGWATGHVPAAVADGLGSSAGHALLVSLAIGAGAYALSLMRGPLEDLLSAHCSATMAADLQGRLARAVSGPAGIEHLEDPRILDLLSAASGELQSTRPADAPMALAGAMGDRLAGLLACGVLATFRWWLGVFFLVGWWSIRPPLRRLLANRANLVRRATPELRHAWYYLGCSWQPDLAKEVRVFGLGDFVLERYRRLWLTGMRPSWDEARRFEQRTLLFGGVVCTMYLIGAGELGHAALDGQVSLRTVTVMLPMFMLAAQVGGVSADDVALEQMLSAVPDLDALVGTLASVDPTPRRALRADGMPSRQICFEEVEYRYTGRVEPALAGLSLELAAGSSLAIVGENGAGKTTLVTLLGKLREPSAGRITVDGRPLAELDARSWQRQMAAVYQDFTRYPLSLRENVALRDLGGTIDEDAFERALEMAGAEGLVARLPLGGDTILSSGYRGGTDLSGGQWQRVALARAFYAVLGGARLLVLDEPTAQLDVRAEAAFFDRFLDLTAGATTIVISHRFSTVRRAQRIAVIEHGRISEIGSHAELMERRGRYATMFEAQAAAFDAPSDGVSGDG